jgi:hypothetical protein
MTAEISAMDFSIDVRESEPLTVEFHRSVCQVSDGHCQIQGWYGYSPLPEHHKKLGSYWAADLPHLDAIHRAVVDHYAVNRSGPVGAFLEPIATLLDAVVATRDGASVYFAQAEDRIKIGWSKQVSARLAGLQTGCPSSIKLLGTIPGGRSVERQLHERFASLRLSGEWFKAEPELLEHIAAVAQ